MDFIKRVEQTKYFIASFTKDLTFDRTSYASYRCESYPSRPVYIERFHNSQPFQRRDDKTYNVRFLSYIYRKDVNSKNKNID